MYEADDVVSQRAVRNGNTPPPPFVLFFDWLNANAKLRHDWLHDMSIKPLLGKNDVAGWT